MALSFRFVRQRGRRKLPYISRQLVYESVDVFSRFAQSMVEGIVYRSVQFDASRRGKNMLTYFCDENEGTYRSVGRGEERARAM